MNQKSIRIVYRFYYPTKVEDTWSKGRKPRPKCLHPSPISFWTFQQFGFSNNTFQVNVSRSRYAYFVKRYLSIIINWIIKIEVLAKSTSKVWTTLTDTNINTSFLQCLKQIIWWENHLNVMKYYCYVCITVKCRKYTCLCNEIFGNNPVTQLFWAFFADGIKTKVLQGFHDDFLLYRHSFWLRYIHVWYLISPIISDNLCHISNV